MALSQTTADAIAEGLGTIEPFVAPLNPLIPFVFSVVQQGIQAEPKLEAALKALFGQTTLTPADFDAAIAHIQQTTYESLVPHTAIPQPIPGPVPQPPG